MAAPRIKKTGGILSLGTATTDLIGMHGVAVAQRAGDAQAVVAQTGAVVATADGSDAGTTQTLANALKVQGNASRADIAALIVLVNELRAALVAKGVIKGAA